MNSFTQQLTADLEGLREAGLLRELRRVDSSQGTHLMANNRPFLNFSSNDYLGLADDPALKDAAARAAEQFGAGSGASRLVCGSLASHHELEERLAAFKATEAALSFSSGYAAALGTVGALLDRNDVVVIDKLAHACLVDAARLCRAKLRVFAHNDLDDLERILRWARQRQIGTAEQKPARAPRVLIITESVFSMDGDLAPLRDLVELKDRHGAWLMVDEAHATGLYGDHRRGLIEEFGVADRVEIQMGTLGKALGSAGGYIAGPRALIDLLVNRARSFIYSTAPVPAAAAAATAAIRLVQSDEGERRRRALWQNVDLTKNALIGGAWTLPVVRSAILPIILGPEERAVALATGLRESGVFIPAIRYPTVARGQARLRITVTARHTTDDIAILRAALTQHASRVM